MPRPGSQRSICRRLFRPSISKEWDAKLSQAQKAYQDELNARMESYQKAVDELNQANQDLNNAPLTDDRTELTQLRDTKQDTARKLEKEIADFRGSRQTELQNERNIMRSGLIDEIRQVVNESIQSNGFHLVLDTSGQGANTGSPVVFQTRGVTDISDEVIKKLNADQQGTSEASPSPSASAPAPDQSKRNGGDKRKRRIKLGAIALHRRSPKRRRIPEGMVSAGRYYSTPARGDGHAAESSPVFCNS